jgi:hypothetical protein
MRGCRKNGPENEAALTKNRSKIFHFVKQTDFDRRELNDFQFLTGQISKTAKRRSWRGGCLQAGAVTATRRAGRVPPGDGGQQPP